MTFANRWARRLLRLGAELLLVALVLLAAEWWMTRDIERGVPLQLSADTLDGSHFDLRQWQGHSGIIYLWAEWCPVCRANRHVITGLVGEVPLITVAMQSGNAHEVSAYLQKEQFTLPVIVDEEGAIARRLHVSGVPVALIIDSQGRVSYVARGYTTELGLRVRLWLAS